MRGECPPGAASKLTYEGVVLDVAYPDGGFLANEETALGAYDISLYDPFMKLVEAEGGRAPRALRRILKKVRNA